MKPTLQTVATFAGRIMIRLFPWCFRSHLRDAYRLGQLAEWQPQPDDQPQPWNAAAPVGSLFPLGGVHFRVTRVSDRGMCAVPVALVGKLRRTVERIEKDAKRGAESISQKAAAD